MRLYLKLATVFCFLGISALTTSCQDGRGRQINEDKTVPPQAQNTNIGPNTGIGDDRNTLINADGWKLPSLSSFSEESKTMLDNNRRTNIQQIEYLPTEEVVQNADGNTFNDAARVAGIDDKSWLIRYLRVFSVKDKPFCYLMRGNLVGLDQEGHVENRLAMSIVLVYSDEDGDGVFETFRYSSSESPSIPPWVRTQ